MALWIKHLRPVWKSDLESMKDAMQEWLCEMKICGLYEGNLDDAFQFIGRKDFWKHWI